MGRSCSTWRTGTSAEEESADQGQDQSDNVDICVRGDGHMDGKPGNRLPHAEPRNSTTLPHEPGGAPGERNQHGLREQCSQNAAAGSTPSARRRANFAGTVGGARGKQAAQIGAGGQQNQPGQQHQARNECPHRAAAAKSPARPGGESENLIPTSSWG